MEKEIIEAMERERVKVKKRAEKMVYSTENAVCAVGGSVQLGLKKEEENTSDITCT